MFQIALFMFCTATTVLSLRIEDVQEGPCSGTPFPPVPEVDFSFFEQHVYEPAGSRYQLYSFASGHPDFDKMREFEFYNNLCLNITNSLTNSLGQGFAIGFGNRLLARFTYTQRRRQPAIVDVTIESPRNGGTGTNNFATFTGTQTTTLTDNKTFAFFANCWNTTNQKSWEVFSTVPRLSAATQRLIEEHALSLGFTRENVVFMKYDGCT